VRLQAVADDEQALLQMALQRLEEFDDLRTAIRALVQSEHALSEAQASDQGQLLPIDVKLDYRGLAFCLAATAARPAPAASLRRPSPTRLPLIIVAIGKLRASSKSVVMRLGYSH